MLPEKCLVLLRSAIPNDSVGGGCTFYPVTMSLSDFSQLIEVVKMIWPSTKRSTPINRQARSTKIDMSVTICGRCNGAEQMKMGACTWHSNNYVCHIAEQMSMSTYERRNPLHSMPYAIDELLGCLLLFLLLFCDRNSPPFSGVILSL